MKLNAKLFLLTFSIITIVSVSSAFIYLTLAQNLLKSHQSKALVNSANDFIFSLQTIIENMDNEFREYQEFKNDISSYSNIDFVFSATRDSIIQKQSFKVKQDIKIYKEVSDLTEFLNYNTNLILRQAHLNNENVFYGIQISPKRINNLSQKIRAEIALVERDVVSIFTNTNDNQYYLPHLSKVTRQLKNKNNFELIIETVDDVDFSATHYSPKSSVITSTGVDFIIFSISDEAANFKDTMSFVTSIIVISGISLSLIFLLIFTAKFRHQLESISIGVKKIAEGSMNERVDVISSDEIGELGVAFNAMLDEIEKRDIEEKEYSEFISIINQNPSLEKIGNATLQKIANTTNIDAGALYLYDENDLKQFAVYGIPQSEKIIINESGFYKKAKEKGELIEITFHENHPLIKTGITELKINYLYVLPIFHNNEIIAIMELASVTKPQIEIKYYLNKIKDQLAIGLANGKALLSLQILVEELKSLNKAYQEQNIEITDKNDELINLHNELKNRSQELEVQTKKAVESEKVKSQFLANMSHELRTPQNAILGLTEVILKDNETSLDTKKKLNVILRNGKKLLNLIENILEYSKLESGNKEIKLSTFWLDEFIQEVSAFVSPLFFEQQVEFIVDTPNQFNYEIYTDQKKLEQIIFNLVGNAAKFTGKGFVKLKIEIIDSSLILSVEDSGPGIVEDDQKIIFEEFRQADGNLNRQFSGSGLGLAICKKYARLLGGEISLESRPGKGSKFIVSLPSVILTKKEIHVAADSRGDNFSALIVSESIDSLELISDYLKAYEIKTIVKSKLTFDLSEIENHKIDIIVIDILSSTENGWRYISELKKSDDYNNIPIVVVNMDGEANCGLGLNIYQYVYGKLNRTSLFGIIENLEEKQSIKFRKILFVMENNEYDKLENELIPDNLKYYNLNGKDNLIEYVKSVDPDIIVLDVFNNNVNIINCIAELTEDLYTKNIPLIGFLNNEAQPENIRNLNNKLFETTLLYQYHPLDVLKVIKDRIEFVNSSIFKRDEIITVSENSVNQGTDKNKKIENGKINVLIVDDDPDARFTIGEIINSLGYNSYFAVDGFDCFDKINKKNPDLILLDIMMPRMDGFQTIKKIRENENLSSLKVYALTAYAMLSDKGIIERNGFDGLITKPINTVQLERKLNQIFITAVK